MRRDNFARSLLLLSAIVALLLIGLMFDIVITSLQVRNAEGAGMESILIVLFSVFELLLMLSGMGFFWYLFASGERSRLVGWFYLVVGLLVLFGTPLLFFLPVPEILLNLVQFIQPGTYVFQIAGVLAVIGLLSLFMKPAARAKAEPDGSALIVEPAEPEV